MDIITEYPPFGAPQLGTCAAHLIAIAPSY